jgi:glucans biosynthesis protein
MAGLHKRNVGPMQAAARCGARTRSGAPCQAPKIAGGKRCRMHGGKGSGAPKGNRNAYKHGLHTRVMKDRKREIHTFVQRAKAVIAEIEAGIPLD